MEAVPDVVPISDLRHRQNDIIERLAEGPVILTQRGRGTAVLVSLERWRDILHRLADLTEALEEAEDIRVSDEILARVKAGDEPTYSHEEVWAEVAAAEAKRGLPH